MKILKRCSIQLVALLSLLLLAACAASSPTMTPEAVLAPTSTSTTVPPTNTPRSTDTPRSTITTTRRSRGPTSTHFPTATPPPVVPTPERPEPTLTSEEERLYVEKMLETNGECELPCWWGIVPGSNTIEVLRKIKAYGEPFPHQDGTVEYGVDSFEVLTAKGKPGYYVWIGVVDFAGKIISIGISGGIKFDTSRDGFVAAWKQYSVDQLLTRYGIPSAVRIQLSPRSEPGASLGYALTLVYDRLGILISYRGEATDGSKADFIQACPLLTNVDRIDLKLQLPTAPTRFPLLRPTDPGYDRSLEEATGMSLEDFYNKFKNPTNQDCLEGEPTLP